MRIAVDTQIILRNHARRMVFAAAEVAGAQVILPITAVAMAKVNYARVSKEYVKKRLSWEEARERSEFSDEEWAKRLEDRLDQVAAGFSLWLDSESRRNDSYIQIVERSRKAKYLARELDLAGVVEDPKDTRWGVGEDPYVIAEALEAGAHWMASDNLQTVKKEEMEEWLDEVQAKGRYTHVPRPFILSAERALDTLLRRAGHGITLREEGDRLRIALANAVSRPNSTEGGLTRRLGVLERFANELTDCGMRRSGEALWKWQARRAVALFTGTPEQRAEGSNDAWARLEELEWTIGVERVQGTREAEERRLQLEEKGGRVRNTQTRTRRGSGGRSS